MRSEATGSNNNNNNNNNNDESLPIASLRLLAPPLRLVSAAMWKVMQQRDAMHYGKLEEFVTSVSETVPGLLSYRHQAKLTVGLRARMILEQLRVTEYSVPELVLPQLERLHAPASHHSKRMKTDQKVEMAVKNFHTLVQTLLENQADREQFFKEEFDSQYGTQYDRALEKLLWEFLTRLDQLLPVPDLAQTVSWLTAAPAVLEECAHSASQPQLLRTLLLHEKCLGHMDSAASVPSFIGDSILSSLSLPLSGKVQNSNQSGSILAQNILPSPTSSSQKNNRRRAKGTVSHITPVIGSISPADVQNDASTNRKAASISGNYIEEAITKVSNDTRVKSRSSKKSEVLQKIQNQERHVGKVLITVINKSPTQHTSSEVGEEDESQIRPVTRNSQKNGVKNKQGMHSGGKMLHLERKRKRKESCKTFQKNSQCTKPQEEESLHADRAYCMKRQLKVVIPKLEINVSNQTVLLSTMSSEEHATVSPRKLAIEGESAARTVDAANRKRKLIVSVTPEKNLAGNIDKQVYAGSPCIPTLMPLRMENSDTVSPATESTDDIIVDSEDEATEKVKGRLFTKRYCKTKSDTYIPTLHEFWTPGFFRRDLLSPGDGCR